MSLATLPMACVFYQVRLPKSIQNPVKSSSTCFQFFSNLLQCNLIYSNLNQMWPKIPHGSKKLSCTYKVNQPKSFGEMVGWSPFNPVRHPPFPMSLSFAKIPSLHRWFLWHCLGNPSDAFDDWCCWDRTFACCFGCQEFMTSCFEATKNGGETFPRPSVGEWWVTNICIPWAPQTYIFRGVYGK